MPVLVATHHYTIYFLSSRDLNRRELSFLANETKESRSQTADQVIYLTLKGTQVPPTNIGRHESKQKKTTTPKNNTTLPALSTQTLQTRTHKKKQQLYSGAGTHATNAFSQQKENRTIVPPFTLLKKKIKSIPLPIQ